ncbi:MAG: 16S rRNA (guanine(527)-N(7))-methyltransferase RsmG [Firmicutes bacterium]|nr:16S rRNA (guanine(527)-N(7))-methyltransferase RsmG [Bacillota bacterium]
MVRCEMEIVDGAKSMGVLVATEAEPLFELHRSMIVEWNQRLNLTSIPVQEMGEKHFLDSLTLLLLPEVEKSRRLIDVGSGAGFPGVPIKIARPNMQITLIDSLQKRIEFLKNVIDSLGLEGINCFHGRAEEIGQNRTHREQYDAAVARAVAPLVLLAEYLLPLVRVGGTMVAMKGPGGRDEVPEAADAVEMLGGELSRIIDTALPSGDRRQLVVIKKMTATAERYPRRPGIPRKNPLSRKK